MLRGKVETRIAAAAWFVIAGAFMGSVAHGQTAPRTAAVMEQDQYFALPGKADEVYQVRVQACDVLEKLGLPRGTVLRRLGKSATLPDVIWQMEFADEAAQQRSLKIRLESPEFTRVRDQMKTLLSHGDYGIFEK